MLVEVSYITMLNFLKLNSNKGITIGVILIAIGISFISYQYLLEKNQETKERKKHYCKSCGKLLNNNSTYCLECGYKI